MSAIETLIMAICIGPAGDSHEACLKALDAGTKQSGIATNVNRAEDDLSKKADKEVRQFLGTGADLTAGAAFLVKSAVDKSATFKFPVIMPQMYFNTNIGKDKSTMGLEWKF